MSQRDKSLDYIKAVACILMVIAHSKVEGSGLFFYGVKFLGQLAPLLFFSATGAALSINKPTKNISIKLLFYITLFIFGFAYNGIHVTDYWHVFEADILQCIALSAIILILLLKVMPAKYMIFLVPIPLILHLLIRRYASIDDFFLRSIVTSPGVFPLLPWLSFFIFGAFIYSLRMKLRAISLTILLVATTAISQTGLRDNMFNKWNMDWGYFILALTIIAAVFTISPLFSKNYNIKILKVLGMNSLVFLFIHYIPVRILESIGVTHPIPVWIINTVAAILLTYLASRYSDYIQKPFTSIKTWAILLLFVVLTPFIFRYKSVIHIASFISGILYSLNYVQLKRLMKEYIERYKSKEALKICPEN